jgi:hypothetical protein
MLGKDAKLRNRRSDLRQFVNRFTLDKPRKKFLRQSLWGITMSRSLVVRRWLRYLPRADRCRQPFNRQKRLLNQLNNTNFDKLDPVGQHLRQWAEHIHPDTPLIFDMCDLAKPRARLLKYIALVRDGSNDGKLVNGYWCFEAYAYFGKNRIVPLLLHPFSSEDPQVKSENHLILQCVSRVFAATRGKGVIVFDAGADRDALMIPWIDDHRHFVIRTRGDRHLLLPNGTRIEAKLLAETMLAHAARERPSRRVVWQRVYLPERPNDPLYLVARILKGRDKPLILLTTLTAQDLATAKNVLDYYRRRWKCEEAARFLKTDLGLERFCLRTYESFPRLLFLAALAMTFLTWLMLRQPELVKWLCEKSPGYHKIKFAYYRMLNWLQEQITPANTIPAPP